MGIFYCGVAADDTMFAPVRSARIYFVKLVPEYEALYNHVGGAGNCDDPTVNEKAKALCYIKQNKIRDLDQFGRAGDFSTCHRLTNRLDHDVAYEHTMACFSDSLYKVADKMDWGGTDTKGVTWTSSFKPWKFKDDSASQTPAASTIKMDFWASMPGYSVAWNYNKTTNTYSRLNDNQPSIDLNTGEQIAAKTVVVQYVKEYTNLDEHKHLDYDVIGKGKAQIFRDGEVVNGTWAKTSAKSRTIFSDDTGKEIQFNKGLIWIELMPNTNQVEYN
jgi:hypothetical protein